jgi:hypothetical protein
MGMGDLSIQAINQRIGQDRIASVELPKGNKVLRNIIVIYI